MQTIHEESAFTSLQQQNPLAVEERIQLCAPFSQQTRTWVKNLSKDHTNVTKYRALRSQIFEFLGITSFTQLSELLKHPDKQLDRSQRACLLLGNMFGLNGTSREIESRVCEYARTADAVVNSLKAKILKPYEKEIKQVSRVNLVTDVCSRILSLLYQTA